MAHDVNVGIEPPQISTSASQAPTAFTQIKSLPTYDTNNIAHKVSVSRVPIDQFIDELIVGQDTQLPDLNTITTSTILRWEYESRNLPTIDLHRFDGTSSKWPKFIENFKTRVHMKLSFDDNTRMERHLSVLDGEAEISIQSIGSNGIFYATALKTLKRDFGNPVVVSQLKLKAVLDMPQIPTNDRTSLRRYHQQLSSTIIWLTSMGYSSAINSTENLAKAVARLPNFLRNQFYRTSKDKIFTEGGMSLVDLEKWLDSKLKEQFNPIACLIAEQETKLKKDNTKIKLRSFTTSTTTNKVLKCWICNENHTV